MKKPTGDAIVWPKPSEIPYQPKVHNFIVYVKAPGEMSVHHWGKAFKKKLAYSFKRFQSNQDQWRDLVKNSSNWRDFRDEKAKGLKKKRFPDFVHKQTGYALWFNCYPTWVLPGFEKLEFDVPVASAKGSSEKKSNDRDEESWKDLVENPSQWWDNRTNKRNPKCPDFRHKKTGQGLCINSSPDWALSKLPPLN